MMYEHAFLWKMCSVSICDDVYIERDTAVTIHLIATTDAPKMSKTLLTIKSLPNRRAQVRTVSADAFLNSAFL